MKSRETKYKLDDFDQDLNEGRHSSRIKKQRRTNNKQSLKAQKDKLNGEEDKENFTEEAKSEVSGDENGGKNHDKSKYDE